MMSDLDNAGRATAIKSSISISDVIREAVHLRPAGRELVGRCPFHADSTPSMYVNDENGVFHCFGCEAAGDAIDFVQRYENVDFDEACERLDSRTYPSRRNEIIRVDRDTVSAARSIWHDAEPPEGTSAEAYLSGRALPLDLLPDLPYLRFARLSFDASGKKYPALVAAVQNFDNEVMGVHRIYLNEDGSKLHDGDVKRSLGAIKGNAIWLNHDWHFSEMQPEHLVVSEGLEDALSQARMDGEEYHSLVYQGVENPLERKLYWASGGAGMLAALEVPDWIRIVTIAVDNDVASTRSAHALIRRLTQRGIECRIHAPPRDKTIPGAATSLIPAPVWLDEPSPDRRSDG